MVAHHADELAAYQDAAYAGRYRNLVMQAQQAELELDCEVVEHSQKPVPMALAAQRLSAAIREKRLRHRASAEFTKQLLAAKPKPVGEGWRLVKERRTGMQIDAAIALAMAISFAADAQPESEVMVSFG